MTKPNNQQNQNNNNNNNNRNNNFRSPMHKQRGNNNNGANKRPRTDSELASAGNSPNKVLFGLIISYIFSFYYRLITISLPIGGNL